MDYLPENDEDGKKVSICVCINIYTCTRVGVCCQLANAQNIKYKT